MKLAGCLLSNPFSRNGRARSIPKASHLELLEGAPGAAGLGNLSIHRWQGGVQTCQGCNRFFVETPSLQNICPARNCSPQASETLASPLAFFFHVLLALASCLQNAGFCACFLLPCLASFHVCLLLALASYLFPFFLNLIAPSLVPASLMRSPCCWQGSADFQPSMLQDDYTRLCLSKMYIMDLLTFTA